MNQVPTRKGFLSTSRILCAVEMGEHVIKQVLGVEPGNAVGYMLLKNSIFVMYNSCGNCTSTMELILGQVQNVYLKEHDLPCFGVQDLILDSTFDNLCFLEHKWKGALLFSHGGKLNLEPFVTWVCDLTNKMLVARSRTTTRINLGTSWK